MGVFSEKTWVKFVDSSYNIFPEMTLVKFVDSSFEGDDIGEVC